LIDNFYPSQHEAAYVEAAAFIDFLVDRFGADQFTRFLIGLRRQLDESDSALIDRGLRASFGQGLDELETEWQTWLRDRQPSEADRSAMLGSIEFYNTVRHYEQRLDPSAYYLSLWAPDIQAAETRGLVADYQRHPDRPENIALETMLIAADHALLKTEPAGAQALLTSLNHTLDSGLTFDDPLAAQYLTVVNSLLAQGYEPQQIDLADSTAEVWATQGDSTLIRLSATLTQDRWTIQLAQ
jgi:hypothetical protein